MEHYFELAIQVKSCYDMESYGALKQVDHRSTADARAHDILENTTVHNGKRYDVGMLWAEDNIELPKNYLSALVQLKSLEKRLTKNQTLREAYSNTIKKDLDKGYVVKIKDAHKVESCSEREWYLPHHPFVNAIKLGKVRRVLNGADKFHGASLDKSLLTGPDLLQNLIYVLLRFRQHLFAVSNDIEGMFLRVGVLPCDQPSLRFLWREDPHQMLWYTSIHATSLGQKLCPPTPTPHFNARQVIMLSSTQKLRKPSLRSSTWVIT